MIYSFSNRVFLFVNLNNIGENRFSMPKDSVLRLYLNFDSFIIKAENVNK